MSDTELAWAAGLFDGEGSSHVMRGKVQVAVTQCDFELPQVLERFWLAVDTGNIYGPYARKEPRKPQYQWSAWGDEARFAMESIWPYLGEVKKAQYQRELEKSDSKSLPKNEGHQTEETK